MIVPIPIPLVIAFDEPLPWWALIPIIILTIFCFYLICKAMDEQTKLMKSMNRWSCYELKEEKKAK